ncbi:hypothetical protein B0H63DRAFT_238563 [Podospora didyma]|uniref:Uncharacterized protein n=1 Tax=Podospora didyma TaxID=330526 RepID=A0AAE0NC06_9PEZI|nr:hypothetical protein B0H63DRAFT_238563 [Podospora didyma]
MQTFCYFGIQSLNRSRICLFVLPCGFCYTDCQPTHELGAVATYNHHICCQVRMCNEMRNDYIDVVMRQCGLPNNSSALCSSYPLLFFAGG